MSHKKIQKLCFYANVWSLITVDETIVPNIEFQAWVHGPVNTDIYAKCKQFSWRDIMVEEESKEKSIAEVNAIFSDKQKEILDFTWEVYGDMTADELETLTHSEDPWLITRQGLGKFENSNKVIPNQLIKEFYTKRYEKYLQI